MPLGAGEKTAGRVYTLLGRRGDRWGRNTRFGQEWPLTARARLTKLTASCGGRVRCRAMARFTLCGDPRIFLNTIPLRFNCCNRFRHEGYALFGPRRARESRRTAARVAREVGSKPAVRQAERTESCRLIPISRGGEDQRVVTQADEIDAAPALCRGMRGRQNGHERFDGHPVKVQLRWVRFARPQYGDVQSAIHQTLHQGHGIGFLQANLDIGIRASELADTGRNDRVSGRRCR